MSILRDGVIWASGLFEGEGCITTRGKKQMQLEVVSTDEHTVRRFLAAVGVGRVNGPYSTDVASGYSRKPKWRWTATGFEKSQAVVAMLWFGLSPRRRARAKELLSTWRYSKPRNTSGLLRGPKKAVR